MLNLGVTTALYIPSFILDFKGREHQNMKDLSFASACIAGYYKDGADKVNECCEGLPRNRTIFDTAKKTWARGKISSFLSKGIPSLLLVDRAQRLGLPAKVAWGIGSLSLVAESVAFTLDLLSISLLTESELCVQLRDIAMRVSYYTERGAWGGLVVLNALLIKDCRSNNCSKNQEAQNIYYLAAAIFSGIHFYCKKAISVSSDKDLFLSPHLKTKLDNDKILETRRSLLVGEGEGVDLEDEQWDSLTEDSVKELSRTGQRDKGLELTLSLRKAIKQISDDFESKDEEVKTLDSKLEVFEKLCQIKNTITNEKYNISHKDLQTEYFVKELEKQLTLLSTEIMNFSVVDEKGKGQDRQHCPFNPQASSPSNQKEMQAGERVKHLHRLLLSVQGLKSPPLSELIEVKLSEFIEEKLNDQAKKNFLNMIKSQALAPINSIGWAKTTDLLKVWEEISPCKEGRSKSPLITFLLDQLKEISLELKNDGSISDGSHFVDWAYVFSAIAPDLEDEQIKAKHLGLFLNKQLLAVGEGRNSTPAVVMHFSVAFNILKPLIDSDELLKIVVDPLNNGEFSLLGKHLLRHFERFMGLYSKDLSLYLKTDHILRTVVREHLENGFLSEIDNENPYFSLIREICNHVLTPDEYNQRFELIEAFTSQLAQVDKAIFRLKPNFEFENESLKSSDYPLVKELESFIRCGLPDRYKAKKPLEKFMGVKECFYLFCAQNNITIDSGDELSFNEIQNMNKTPNGEIKKGLALIQAHNGILNISFDEEVNKKELIKKELEDYLDGPLFLENVFPEFFNFVLEGKNLDSIDENLQVFILDCLSRRINFDSSNRKSLDEINKSNYLSFLDGDNTYSNILEKLSIQEEGDSPISRYMVDKSRYISFILRLEPLKKTFEKFYRENSEENAVAQCKKVLKEAVIVHTKECGSLDWILVDPAFEGLYQTRQDIYDLYTDDEARKKLVGQHYTQLHRDVDTQSTFDCVLRVLADQAQAQAQKALANEKAKQ